ncbi:FAD-dependent oxidoreductase [Glutamicibacter halophytocola]|uniref:FAD-dependent oxidoreductase n=1 Tax=Glutamicibacter halophytocola TaxID=1933880 RepID=A0ABX5YBV7_9MICC|nr:FAD-dependent oxidoreductase [Glutamicibacter halophytocola]NQD41060.1 FAD-dependent oxidoreductase [Glutamicibacter halophytocola]QDY67129.1 FAD-dependent oxidoreductase [Glutamicibacter halophytocola]
MSTSSQSPSAEYVVIGAGLAGSSTAWRLAQRGYEVALLERKVPAAADASSHGSARIFRYAYPDQFYTDLVVRARTAWDELEEASGSQLIAPHGSVDYGPLRNPRHLAEILANSGVEHELLSAAEARNRFNGINFDTEVLWHPGAGVLDSERSVQAMVEQAKIHGAKVETQWPVASVEATANGYKLTSSDGRTYLASKIIVTAGGWLPELLGNLPLPSGFLRSIPTMDIYQENAYHFPYRDQDPEARLAWPTYIHKDPAFKSYGLPGGRDASFRGQKVAEYMAGHRMDTASQQNGQIDPANRERVIEYVKKYLPGLEPTPYAETTCIFSATPTEDFIMDEADGITILSPCSGHGAKFGPLLGELAADLATGARETPELFRLASHAKAMA